MHLCILENDARDPRMAPHIERIGDLFVRLFRAAGADDWRFDVFHTLAGEYPESFTGYDAVILTGSRADAFSSEPWIVELRARVVQLLEQRKKLLGICFGHQVLGVCLGAPVGRAPRGWNMGRMRYDWHDPRFPFPHGATSFELLTTHQDQVLALPSGARLLASTPNCPVAAFAVDDHVFSMQPHPEMDAIILGNLIHARREKLGEQKFVDGIASIREGHDGLAMARLMMAFVSGARD
jgi:GMP synthase-like glutamine amidotransferase